MSALRKIGPVEGDRVEVEAGAKWSEVLRATLAQGMTPPVLTDYLELSVGGTLVVGGVGGTTSVFGVQSDHVIELEVVTGNGQTFACSASHNADLFDAVRAGLGQVGVITKATLELVAAPESVRRFFLFYPDLATMLNDARLLADESRFDAVQGAIAFAPDGGIAFRLDAAKNFDGNAPDDDALLAGLSDDPARREPTTIAYFDYLNRFAALEAALRANGQWRFPHPWLTTFIGDSRVESVVKRRARGAQPGRGPGPARPGRALSDPQVGDLQPAAAAAGRRPLLRVQPDPHPGDR